VVPGGAAERAGVLEGDVVDAVNGADLEGKTLAQVLLSSSVLLSSLELSDTNVYEP